MSRITGSIARGLAGAVVAIAFTGAHALTDADLTTPTFESQVGLVGCGEPLWCASGDRHVPGTIDIDVSFSEAGQGVGRVITSALGPKLDITINSSGVSAPEVFGYARIAYSFAITRRVDDAPADPVRVRVSVEGAASATGRSTGGAAYSGGFFEIIVPDPFGTGSREFRGEACVGATCGSSDPSAEVNLTFAYMLPPNVELFVVKAGSASARAVGNDYSMEAQVVADPRFTIDPEFLVDYAGTPTPAPELYQLIYSTGITPVPEPHAYASMAVSFPLIWLLRRWRATSRQCHSA